MILSDTKVLIEIVALFVGTDCDKDLDGIMIQYSLCNASAFGRGTAQPTSALLC